MSERVKVFLDYSSERLIAYLEGRDQGKAKSKNSVFNRKFAMNFDGPDILIIISA